MEQSEEVYKIKQLEKRISFLEYTIEKAVAESKSLVEKVREYERFTGQLILIHGDLDAGIERYKEFRKLDWSRLSANCKQMERIARQTIDFIEGDK